jgi:hypothetical protein
MMALASRQFENQTRKSSAAMIATVTAAKPHEGRSPHGDSGGA